MRRLLLFAVLCASFGFGQTTMGPIKTKAINGVRMADQFSSITTALSDAGSTGWVLIPKNYVGSDTYTSGTYKNVIDLRGNFFGVYQYIGTSRPITGYPLGNDLALSADGPADMVLVNGDLGNAITTTATAITAATPTTITVGDSTKFSTSAAYVRIEPGKGDGVDDTCTLNSVANSTHMNVTCVYSHSGTVDVWQKGNLVFKGWAGLSLSPTQPANLSAYKFPFFIGSSFAYLMSIGINPSDTWPHNGIAFSEALTGMSTGSANHFPVPNDLILRIADASHVIRMQTSSAGNAMVFSDSLVQFGNPLVPATAGGSSYTIGTAGVPWRTYYIGSSASNYTTITSNASTTRTFAFPDVSGTGAVIDAAQTYSAKPTFGAGLDVTTINATTAYQASGTPGMSATLTVRNSAGSGTCTITVTQGLITASTC